MITYTISPKKQIPKPPFLAVIKEYNCLRNSDTIVLINNVDGGLIDFTELSGNNIGGTSACSELEFEVYEGEITLTNTEVQ